ncbi:hypothetical protein DYB32_007082 [Aphanomyces invadans]|uniref:Uncharacterized protein n=1 Tax=Aphanomyces invadans TaxID=157072 RepID=A0A3R6VIJ9_9STRA|nr:hypothetical protein DYB32_007082 [Aphanomyces invadans]
MASALRDLGDFSDMFTSIYLVIFGVFILPLTLYVAFRGILAPKLSALVAAVSICFIFSYSIEYISEFAYYLGLAAIPALAIVIWIVEGASPVLVAAALPLHAVYTIYSMFLVQTVTEPSGAIYFGVPSATSWVTCLFVAIFLAISTGFFMVYADAEPQRQLYIWSSASTGIFFAVHYVGAALSGPVLVSSSDYFKIFALRPWISWPVAVVLTAAAAFTQFNTKVPSPPARPNSESQPLVSQA